MVVLFWKHSSGTQSRSRLCLAFSSVPSPSRIRGGIGDKSKVFYLFNIMKSKSRGLGWKGKREERRIVSCQTEGSSQNLEEASVPAPLPVLCLASSWLSPVRTHPVLPSSEPPFIAQSQFHKPQEGSMWREAKFCPCPGDYDTQNIPLV